MKQLFLTAAIFAIVVSSAGAQELFQVKRDAVLPAKVMGSVVKGSPYTADEITELVQVLGDGTRITKQSQVTVYRDGEGRVRRESPDQITIWDAVENVSYTLDPKAMTAVKSSMARGGVPVAMTTTGGQTVQFYFNTAGDGATQTATSTTTGASDEKLAAVMLDKLTAEAAASKMLVDGAVADAAKSEAMQEQLKAAKVKMARQVQQDSAKTESLGKQVMQGVSVDGSRETSTIETGAIGNDRPINVVSERWYSSELQTVVLTKHSDPRTGEETFRLANVRRGEPGADLFMLPPGYQLVDNRMRVVFPDKIMLPAKKEE